MDANGNAVSPARLQPSTELPHDFCSRLLLRQSTTATRLHRQNVAALQDCSQQPFTGLALGDRDGHQQCPRGPPEQHLRHEERSAPATIRLCARGKMKHYLCTDFTYRYASGLRSRRTQIHIVESKRRWALGSFADTRILRSRSATAGRLLSSSFQFPFSRAGTRCSSGM
jgi:hypothetical protein